MTAEPETERIVSRPSGNNPAEGLPPDWSAVAADNPATVTCLNDGTVDGLSLDACHAIGLLRDLSSPGEAVGKPLVSLLGDCDLARHLQQHLRPNSPVQEMPAWFTDSTGERRWVLFDVASSDSATDKPTPRIAVTLRDITAFMREDLDRRIQRTHDDRLRYHGLPCGVMIHDEAGVMLRTGGMRADMLGYTREEMESLTLADIIHGYTDEGLARHWARTENGPYESGRGVWIRKGGGLTAFTGQRSILLDYGNRALMRSTAVSMHAHLRHHEVLSSTLGAVLRITGQLVESPNVHVLCGRAVRLGREALGLERCSIYLVEDDMVHGSWGTDEYGEPVDERDITFPLDETWRSLARREHLYTERSRVEWDVDLFEHGSGRMQPCGKGWLARTPIFSGDTLVAVLFNDSGATAMPYEPARQEALEVYCSQLGSILAMKRTEEQKLAIEKRLREGERLQAMGNLAGSIAHDLNNLLVPVVACPTLALKVIEDLRDKGTELDADGLKFLLESIRTGLQDILMLLRDALVLGSDEDDEAGAEIQVAGVIQRLVRSVQFQSLLRMNPGIVFSLHTDDTPMPVCGSEAKLRRILVNLTGNAVDAMEGKGSLSVAARRTAVADHDGRREFWPAGAQACARIEVADTGCGIPEENLTRIFEPFFSTKEQSHHSGTGLGLAIVFDMVRQFGGRIEVRSQPGKGTRFILRLPLLV